MKHPLAIDLADFIDGQLPENRMMLAHIAACRWCQRSMVNLVQSNQDYPDLYANPEDHPRVFSPDPSRAASEDGCEWGRR